MTTARPLVWIYDLQGNRLLPIHDLGGLVVEDRLADVQSLSFEIRANDPKAYAVQPDRLVSYNNRLYRIEELEQARNGSQATVVAYCEARWMDLGKLTRAGSIAILGRTALAGLTNILAGTGWTAAVETVSADTYSLEDIDASVLSLVRRWAGIVGQEIEYDTNNRIVRLVDQIGEDRGIGFRYGSNLRSIRRRYRPPIATRLYPFGANNLDISNVNPSGLTFIEDYSWYTAQGLSLLQARSLYRKDQIWNDSRYLVALNLYDAAVRRLAVLATPAISYELDVADFAQLTGSTADDVEIGDVVRVRDREFAVDISTRVVRRIVRPLRPQDNEIELEYLQPGLTEIEDPEQTRSIDYGELSVLVDKNAAALTVDSTVTQFASIQVTSTGETTAIVGGTFRGTASGTGTVRFSLAVNGTDEVPVYEFAFTNGAQVEFSWPTFVTGVDASSTATITWRARVISGTGTISLPIDAGRGWLLVRGAVGVGISNSPSQLVDETVVLEVLEPVDEVTVDVIDPVDLAPSETLDGEIHTITTAASTTFI